MEITYDLTMLPDGAELRSVVAEPATEVEFLEAESVAGNHNFTELEARILPQWLGATPAASGRVRR